MTYSEVEKEIDRVEQELIDAVGRKDADALDRLVSDDFVITGETLGETLADKKIYVADCLATGEAEGGSASYDRMKFLVYGNTAIVISKFKYQVKISGKEYSGAFLATRIWVKNDDQWQLIATHSHQLAEKTS
ncbi:MAG: nuclear transport factor 2 family protein [Acidobacteria bacterium]|nr:nuclear transport factor 2 family protein [Acidobacteriota bacterium]